MADSELKSKVLKGTFWTLLEKFSKQIVLFVVGIVLARLLSPTDYGTATHFCIGQVRDVKNEQYSC